MSTWATKPPTANAILDYDFNINTMSANGVFDVYGSALAATDGTAPTSPSSCIKSRIEAGSHTGGMQLGYSFPTYTDMFVGLTWRSNASFEGRPQGNKMFFMRGPATNGCFLWGNSALSGGSHSLLWAMNTAGIDNSHLPGAPDAVSVILFPNVASGVLTRGNWYRISAYVKKSTTNTSRDGIIRWWINDTMVGNFTNVNYAGAGLSDWTWSETWDGTPNFTVTTPWEHYLDHLYIASSAAPGGGGGGTTSPPTFTSLTPATATLSPGNTQVFTAGMSGAVSSSTVIALSSSNSSIFTVDPSATIASGSASTTFNVLAGSTGSATLTATLGSTSRTSAVTVQTSGGTSSPVTYTFASQFSGVQGQNQWSYRDTGGNLLTYNAGGNKWEGDQLFLSIFPGGFVHGYNGSKKGAVLRWTATDAGSIDVTGDARLYDATGLGTFTVTYNSSTVKFGPQTMAYPTSYPYSFAQAVSPGDTIDFIMNGTSPTTNDNTQLNPVIVFTPTSTGSTAITVSSFTPSHGNTGSSVTIVGTGFSATAVNNTVTVNGAPATVTSASTTQLIFTVPASATTGLVNVSTSAGSVSAGTFTVDNPTTPDTPPASNFGGSAMLLLVMP